MTPFDAKARARECAPCWGDGIAGPKNCDEVYDCELHHHIAAALSEAYQEGIRYGQTEMYWNDKRVGDLMAEARASADELFFLDVDCELGSGCLKDRTCSGASHWLTAAQIRAEALEEAAGK